MRGLFTPITKIRRQVFTEIARFAYERDMSAMDFSPLYETPYVIIPGEVPQYRESVFKERAIVKERVRMGMGLSRRPVDEHRPYTDGMRDAANPDYRFQEPLVSVIPFACAACPTNRFEVTSHCVKCLAHPCSIVCPVNAITIGKTQAVIDQDKCIKCGRCVSACPYHSIIQFGRPCAEACGADAIDSDDLGRAVINQDKCVACGLCMVSCPFAAIADKSEILQIITAIRQGRKVVAEIAPSFTGQFGPLATPGKVVSGLRQLGFSDVIEVGLGADIGSLYEAEYFLKHVPDHQPYLGTSCCPSWEEFAVKTTPEQASCIASSHTPMVATARHVKDQHPDAFVVFIGPCVAKKREAIEPVVQPYVDYVLTFEELMGMFSARNVELSDLEDIPLRVMASADGRSYAAEGGVAHAITQAAKSIQSDVNIPMLKADSLAGCKKMLMLAKAGKADGHLLEGMACPGGCIGGPGTLTPLKRAENAVQAFAKESPFDHAQDNPNATVRQD